MNNSLDYEIYFTVFKQIISFNEMCFLLGGKSVSGVFVSDTTVLLLVGNDIE